MAFKSGPFPFKQDSVLSYTAAVLLCSLTVLIFTHLLWVKSWQSAFNNNQTFLQDFAARQHGMVEWLQLEVAKGILN